MSTDNPLFAAILSGGSGLRLWPQSRSSRPKQFVELMGDETLFSMCLRRVASITPEKPIVIANEQHRFLVAEELRAGNIDTPKIILEPDARNTAPAVALAALQALEQDKDALLLVCPADHLLEDLVAFGDAIAAAKLQALAGNIVTFGVVPVRPETGYGYISVDLKNPGSVLEFVEKPNLETAESYLEKGNYFWNSGIFLARADVLLSELSVHAPDIASASQAAWASRSFDGDFVRVAKEEFFKCPADSIDYAVMEKTILIKMVPLDCQWSDLGSWDSVWRESDKDENGNATVGDVQLMDARNNYIRSSGKLVSVLGCDDLVVVVEGDSVLVAKQDRAQEVKILAEDLRKAGRSETDEHACVHRPWGNYEGVDRGERYQVKRIVVKPQGKLSLQKHHHRAEHWVVVKGTALVTCGDTQAMLTENQSVYIPLGQIHRLENPGSIPLELIEIQSGSYLGEDDIVRFDDKYGRTASNADDNQSPMKTAKLRVVNND